MKFNPSLRTIALTLSGQLITPIRSERSSPTLVRLEFELNASLPNFYRPPTRDHKKFLKASLDFQTYAL